MASKFNLRMSVIGGEFEGTLKTLAQNVTHKTAHSVAQEVVRVAVENLINPRGSGRMTGLSSGGDPNKKGYPHVDTGALL
jgi:hypothetical protein